MTTATRGRSNGKSGEAFVISAEFNEESQRGSRGTIRKRRRKRREGERENEVQTAERRVFKDCK